MFHPFTYPLAVTDANRDVLARIRAEAEKLLHQPLCALSYHNFHLFRTKGSRGEYESEYFEHRRQLCIFTAMVLVTTENGPRLYAAAWVENLPWQVNDYTRFLRQTKNVYISLYKPDLHTVPVYSVDYSVQGGIKSDLFTFFCNELWCMRGHIDKCSGVNVMNHFGEVERTEGVAFKEYLCDDPFFLDYMQDISAFPITREAAEALGLDNIALDFSAVSDMRYYNGLVFCGYADGAAAPVLSGGRYDPVLASLGKKGSAVGFAVYLDQAERLTPTPREEKAYTPPKGGSLKDMALDKASQLREDA